MTLSFPELGKLGPLFPEVKNDSKNDVWQMLMVMIVAMIIMMVILMIRLTQITEKYTYIVDFDF